MIEVLERYEGNVTKAAREFAISQRQLRKIIVREKLDPEIENMRVPEWLRRTREALR